MIGEVRWRSEPMGVDILGEIDRFKVPALVQAGVEVSRPAIVLVSRAGFTDRLNEAAARDARIMLVDPEVLAGGAVSA